MDPRANLKEINLEELVIRLVVLIFPPIYLTPVTNSVTTLDRATWKWTDSFLKPILDLSESKKLSK